MPDTKATTLFSLILVLIFTAAAAAAHSPPEGARVFFVNPKDGASISGQFTVIFGIQGFGVTTAGDGAKRKHVAGHHHLLVDMDKLPDMEQPLPYNPHVIHYDRGESEAKIELPTGQHTLQILLTDEGHEPHNPPLLSEKISITVK